MPCCKSPQYLSSSSIAIYYQQDFNEEYLNYLRGDYLDSVAEIQRKQKVIQIFEIQQSNVQDSLQQYYAAIYSNDKDQAKQLIINEEWFAINLNRQQSSILQFQDVNNLNSSSFLSKNSIKYHQLQEYIIQKLSIDEKKSICLQFVPAIGLVRSNWYNDKGKLSCYSYGTGFLVSQRIILTCAHNLYDESNVKYANEIIFIPNSDGHIQTSTPQYKSADGRYYRNKPLIPKLQTFSIIPLINELCLVVLKEPIKLSAYIPIGEIQVNEGQEIQICGYPNKSYNSLIRLSLVQLKRSTLIGNLVSVTGNIINHNLATEIGFSGSPILTKDKNGKTVAIGMHSHRGYQDINRGLFFTQQIISLIRQFERSLSLEYDISSTITFQKEFNTSNGCSFICLNGRQQTVAGIQQKQMSQNSIMQQDQLQKLYIQDYEENLLQWKVEQLLKIKQKV